MRLDELKALVAETFKDAEDKQSIENAAKINAKIDEVAAEQRELLDKNKELLDSYKEAVLHTSVKPDPSIQSANDTTTVVSLENMLETWMSTHNPDGTLRKE